MPQAASSRFGTLGTDIARPHSIVCFARMPSAALPEVGRVLRRGFERAAEGAPLPQHRERWLSLPGRRRWVLTRGRRRCRMPSCATSRTWSRRSRPATPLVRTRALVAAWRSGPWDLAAFTAAGHSPIPWPLARAGGSLAGSREEGRKRQVQACRGGCKGGFSQRPPCLAMQPRPTPPSRLGVIFLAV